MTLEGLHFVPVFGKNSDFRLLPQLFHIFPAAHHQQGVPALKGHIRGRGHQIMPLPVDGEDIHAEFVARIGAAQTFPLPTGRKQDLRQLVIAAQLH